MSEKVNVLFLDDESRIVNSLKSLFRRTYNVFTATDGHQALEIVKNNKIQVVVSDQRMPNMLGVEFLKKVKAVSPNTMRLLLTGYSDLDAIIDSINDGEIFRFISKPWDNNKIKEILASAAEAALETEQLYQQQTVTTAQAEVSTQAQTGQVIAGDANTPAILIINKDSSLTTVVKDLIEDGNPVYYSPSLDDVMDILESEEVAVIIAGIGFEDKNSITDFLKLLKQQHPLVMTIVASDIRDADMAIELINQGQIFRYLNKPVRKSMMKLSIKSALRFYYQHKNEQKLLKRHQVEQSNTTSIPNKLLERLRTLGRRLKAS